MNAMIVAGKYGTDTIIVTWSIRIRDCIFKYLIIYYKVTTLKILQAIIQMS